MLFSNILVVKADGISDILKNRLVLGNSLYYDDITISAFSSCDDEIYSGRVYVNSSTLQTITFYADSYNHGFRGHLKLPYVYQFGNTGQSGWDSIFNHSDWDLDAYFYVGGLIDSIPYSWSDGSTSRSVSFYNCHCEDFNSVVFASFSYGVQSAGSYTFIRGRDLLTSSGNTNSQPLNFSGYFECDVFIPDEVRGSSNLSLSFHPSFTYSIWSLKDDFKYDIGSINTTDSITHQELVQLNESTNAIEESVTSDTGGGLLATIKSWFGSFFDNLIHVFVPEDGFFTDWFSRVNTLLSAKLGMLYAPFDLIISILTAVYDSSGTFSGIPIPEIAWEGTVLIPAQTLTFQSLLGNHFSTLQGYVYFGTDVVLLWAFLILLQRKITLIFRGSESG